MATALTMSSTCACFGDAVTTSFTAQGDCDKGSYSEKSREGENFYAWFVSGGEGRHPFTDDHLDNMLRP